MKPLTEITLALLLFADASTLKLNEVREDAALPARLLTIGLLLTIVAGAVVALHPAAAGRAGLRLPAGRHPRADRCGARPADLQQPAGAGAHPAGAEHRERVERRHRHAVCPALSRLCRGDRGAAPADGWLASALIEIALALVAGVGSRRCRRLAAVARRAGRGWTSGVANSSRSWGWRLPPTSARWRSAATASSPHSSAASCSGATAATELVEPTEFTETFGSFLSLLVWGIFGAVLVDRGGFATRLAADRLCHPQPDGGPDGAGGARAASGTGLRRDTVALMGWFGPRGLASVVFTLMALERFHEVGRSEAL